MKIKNVIDKEMPFTFSKVTAKFRVSSFLHEKAFYEIVKANLREMRDRQHMPAKIFSIVTKIDQ